MRNSEQREKNFNFDTTLNLVEIPPITGQVENAENAVTADSLVPSFPRFRPYSKTRKARKIIKYIN